MRYLLACSLAGLLAACAAKKPPRSAATRPGAPASTAPAGATGADSKESDDDGVRDERRPDDMDDSGSTSPSSADPCEGGE